MLAERMLDILVVPNINVLYKIVAQIAWYETNCYDTSSDTVEFDVRSDTSKPSCAFYSRWHIENVKFPELSASLELVEDKNKRAILEQGFAGWHSALDRDETIMKNKGPAKLGICSQTIKGMQLFHLRQLLAWLN